MFTWIGVEYFNPLQAYSKAELLKQNRWDVHYNLTSSALTDFQTCTCGILLTDLPYHCTKSSIILTISNLNMKLKLHFCGTVVRGWVIVTGQPREIVLGPIWSNGVLVLYYRIDMIRNIAVCDYCSKDFKKMLYKCGFMATILKRRVVSFWNVDII